MNPNGTILLAYASLYGSTQEVAEAITTELCLAGMEVEARVMSDIESLDRYAAVILGAAIYNAKWHPDAHRFLSRNQAALGPRPLVIFALGPLSTSAAAMARSQRQLQAELARYPWLKPVATQMFVGKIDPVKLSMFERIGVTPSDKRDWNAIRTWARSMAVQLRQALAQPTAA